MNRPTSPEDVQKVFDCYCKKILKNEAINIQKHYQHLNDVQVSFSELTPEQLAELATYDDYSTDYDLYKVMGYDVKIKNELLSEALQELSEEERFILLLYGLGFNDGEIADLLKIVRRTVNYKRQRGFEKVRKRMEEKVHKGNGLLPYPVIVSASQGDILAMNVVLSHYEPYIARLSMRTSIDEYGNPHTTVDEDMRSRLEAKLIEQVLNFKVA